MVGESVGFTGLLTIVFIVLKLTEYIVWSWWWVLSPIWIFFCLVIVISMAAILLMILLAKHKNKLMNILRKFAKKLNVI